MTRPELIMKNLHSRSFNQPRPVRPFELTDAIVLFSKVSSMPLYSCPIIYLQVQDAKRIALLESLIASIEAGTPPTAPSTLPPPTPRPIPIPLPGPNVQLSKPNTRAKPRPLPPLPSPHLRFRRTLWEISPDSTELPVSCVLSSSQSCVLPNTDTFSAAPPPYTLPAVVSFRALSPSEMVMPPTTGAFNGTGPARPTPNNTNITTQPRDGTDATTAGNQNDSF